MFTPVRMNKLYATVLKDHIGKVISALGDTEACHFIEKQEFMLDLKSKKTLLSLTEKRIDEHLFKIPSGELFKIEIAISNDLDLKLYNLAKEVVDIGKINTTRLVEIKKSLIYLKSIYSVLENFEETQYTYIFEAWVPEGMQDIVRALVDEASYGKNVLYFSSPEFGQTPPTKLSNPGMMKPFETLVKRYGMPSYYEIDPTWIIFMTFPLIFGMMYGDVGHGIVLLILSMGIFLSGKRFKSAVKFKEYAPILMSCSISSISFGFMYGEFFGLKTTPLWLSPSENIAYFLILSVWVGVLHLVMGFILNAINLWKNKKYLRAIFQIQWIIFSGTSMLFFTKFLFMELNRYIESISILILLPVACMIFSGVLINYIEGKGVYPGVLVPFYLGLKYAMHLMSYMRLLIMALAHFTISATIIAISGTSAISLALAALITFVLIIIVETFVVFIQTLRLHWVEWFYLFYKGDGKEFQPFKF